MKKPLWKKLVYAISSSFEMIMIFCAIMLLPKVILEATTLKAQIQLICFVFIIGLFIKQSADTLKEYKEGKLP